MTSKYIVMAMALIVCVGVFVLQYFLAKSDSKIIGYILPSLAFVGALVFSFYYMSRSGDSIIEKIAGLAAPLMLSVIPGIVLLSINSTVKKNKKAARDREAQQIDIDLRKNE